MDGLRKNIGYHTRLFSDNRVKISGGSFGGELSMETANRLVRAFHTVVIKPSGRAVFVDREGREVWLYISVDADKTDAGIAALKAWRIEKDAADETAKAQNEKDQAEIGKLMSNLSHNEIIRRLRE